MMPEVRPVLGYQLAALLEGMADVSSPDDVQVTGLTQEAQTVDHGDLFVAVRGQRTHGLHYLNEALARGATAVAWEPGLAAQPPAVAPVPVVAVQSLRERLGIIADRFFGHPSSELTTIGVTGTDGKTSVSHFLAQALNESHKRCGLIGTLGYGLYGHLRAGRHTTPEPIRLHAELASLRAQGARAAVMEVSSHALDQHRIEGVALDLAILTNVTRDHLDYHASVDAYAATKRRLFEMPGLRCAVVNTDDAFGRTLAGMTRPAFEMLGYGLGESPLPTDKMVRATEVQATPSGLRFKVRTPYGDGSVESGLLGRFNVSNLLAALAALLALGMPLPQARVRLSGIAGAPGRMEHHGGGDRPLVVVDYAHTPAALAQALLALREHCRGRLRCVFGCGGDRDRGKRPLMAQVAERHADEVIVTDDNPRTEPPTAITADIISGFTNPAAVRVIHERAEAIAHAVAHSSVSDVVLIAGKGHEQVQIVGSEQRSFSDSRQVAELLATRSP